MPVRVQSEDFDLGHELDALRKGRTDVGALVSFSGLVRDLDDGGLREMELEHYPGMTQRALEEILAQAKDRWALQAGLIIHRYGVLRPGDQIMMVAAASRHRQNAWNERGARRLDAQAQIRVRAARLAILAGQSGGFC